MNNKINVAIAGLGNVGKGVYKILTQDLEILESRTNTKFEIVAVSARSKKDFVSSKIKFYEDATQIADDENVDVVIEAIGGDTLAKDLIEKSLKNGKKVVSANKALIAGHGFELAKLAEENNGSLKFEAAVAGSLPIIKILREGLVANEFSNFYAILNGTCNFILSKMAHEGLDFAPVLKEAQELGFAEADPTFDVGGIDTAHKLAIMAAIVSKTKPSFDKLYIEGIDKIEISDLDLAKEFGYEIKLLGVYKDLGNNKSQRAIYPALVKKDEKIAKVDLSFNAVVADTSNAGKCMFIGSGAGSLPTASAIVADLADIATNRDSYVFNSKTSNLKEADIIDIKDRVGRYFLKVVVDKELAKTKNLATDLFAGKINIDQLVMKSQDQNIICGFLTKAKSESEVIEILNNLNKDLVKSSKFIRIEEPNFV